MKIINPSNKAIENIRIYGVLYSIPAEGTLDNVPEAHARYWQESLHKFLILRKDKLEDVTKVDIEEKIKIPEPKTETEPTEEVVENVEIAEVVEVEEEEEESYPIISKGKVKGKNK